MQHSDNLLRWEKCLQVDIIFHHHRPSLMSKQAYAMLLHKNEHSFDMILLTVHSKHRQISHGSISILKMHAYQSYGGNPHLRANTTGTPESLQELMMASTCSLMPPFRSSWSMSAARMTDRARPVLRALPTSRMPQMYQRWEGAYMLCDHSSDGWGKEVSTRVQSSLKDSLDSKGQSVLCMHMHMMCIHVRMMFCVCV